jgi:hypothetical protein
MINIDKKKLKEYFDDLSAIEDVFFEDVENLEKEMQEEFDCEYIEFFWQGEGFVGIGTPSCPGKMKLVARPLGEISTEKDYETDT